MVFGYAFVFFPVVLLCNTTSVTLWPFSGKMGHAHEEKSELPVFEINLLSW